MTAWCSLFPPLSTVSTRIKGHLTVPPTVHRPDETCYVAGHQQPWTVKQAARYFPIMICSQIFWSPETTIIGFYSPRCGDISLCYYTHDMRFDALLSISISLMWSDVLTSADQMALITSVSLTISVIILGKCEYNTQNGLYKIVREFIKSP